VAADLTVGFLAGNDRVQLIRSARVFKQSRKGLRGHFLPMRPRSCGKDMGVWCGMCSDEVSRRRPAFGSSDELPIRRVKTGDPESRHYFVFVRWLCARQRFGLPLRTCCE